MGRPKKYNTEEERLEARRLYIKQWREKNAEYEKQYRQINKEKKAEYDKQYRQDNREKILKRKKQYYQYNKETFAEYKKQYLKTPMGRALLLINGYNRADIKMGRGECTLTAKWIIDHIFTKKCIYCGESDWTKLGCDRKNNSLPHTPNNVVPCCASCNKKRGIKPFEEFLAECKQKDLEDIATS